MTTTRLEAFSDGVFAVAITLLVLDLHAPAPGHGSLWQALVNEWPHFAAYAVSFLVIGIIWVNHHAIFHQIAHVDRPLLFYNLLLLIFVVVIPFPTGMLADYLKEGGADAHTAAAIYSAVMLGMSIGFAVIWSYAVFHPHLLRSHVNVPAARKALPRFTGGGGVYVVTVGIAFISAPLCLAIHAAVALYYVFDRTAGRAAFGEQPEQAG